MVRIGYSCLLVLPLARTPHE